AEEYTFQFSIDRTSLGVLPGRAEHYKVNRYWKPGSETPYDASMQPGRWIYDFWGGSRASVPHVYLDIPARDMLCVDYARKHPAGRLNQSAGWLGFGLSFLPRSTFGDPKIERWLSAVNTQLDHRQGSLAGGSGTYELKGGDIIRPDGRVKSANFAVLIDLGKHRPMALIMGYCYTWNGLHDDSLKRHSARDHLEDFLDHLKIEFVDSIPPDERDLAHRSPQLDWDAWRKKQQLKQEELEALAAQQKQIQGQSQAASQSAQVSQAAIEDSVKSAQAVIAHYEKLIQRVETELSGLKPGDPRRSHLENERAMYRNDIENEQYYIETLKSGSAHYQRFSYQDKLATDMREKMRIELSEMALKSRLFLQLPKFIERLSDSDKNAHATFKSELSTFPKGSEGLQKLKDLSTAVRGHLLKQGQARMDIEASRASNADWTLFGAEVVVKAAEATLMVGSLAIPGAANVMMGYGIAQGAFVDGSVVKAFENGVRAYSDGVDVAWAGVQGFFETERVQLADGRIIQRPRGFRGAAEAAAFTYLLNKGMEFVGGALQKKFAGLSGSSGPGTTRPADPNHPLPDVARPDPAKAKDPSTPAGDKVVYKTNEAKYAESRTAIENRFNKDVPRKADNSIDTSHQDYARHEAARKQQLADLDRQYDVILKREKLHHELDQCTRNFDKQIADSPDIPRLADGTPDISSDAYRARRKQWEDQMNAIRARDEFKDTRMPVVENALSASNMTVKDHFSGGRPKNVNSDIDVTPATQKQLDDFLANLARQGHKPASDSPPDRYVFPGLDMVVWKTESPTSLLKKLGGKGEFTAEDMALLRRLYGSDGAIQGKVEWAFHAGSDKFGTIGGVSFTTNLGPKDPLGAVLDNTKKFIDALVDLPFAIPTLVTGIML
ncbi:MAG TPA: hypothetical protein PKO06_13680, partial [Candidatus Ozemobacteraceae bacterium]|nr:hypothetical protein [Candidatus Ozemobacteraceae bacterium]